MHIVAMTFAFLLASVALAQESPHDDMSRTRVQIDAQAAADVDNDTMRATLFSEMEDVESVKLADRVNRVTSDALRTLKNVAGIRVRSGGYTTYPVSERGKILRWRARSELIVEGEDFKRVSEAIGRVQNTVQLGGVVFFVSAATRERVESSLTENAIKAFLARAQLVASTFEGATYHVSEATVSSDGGIAPPPRPMAMRALSSESVAAPPEFEGGTTRITVTVSGSILIPR
jgi:predicted secreted protein